MQADEKGIQPEGGSFSTELAEVHERHCVKGFHSSFRPWNPLCRCAMIEGKGEETFDWLRWLKRENLPAKDAAYPCK